MKLLDFYRSILSATGHNVTGDGFVNRDLGESRYPTLINGEPLVLPTIDHQRNPNGNILFHPVQEDLMRGPSEVLEYFRKSIRVELESQLSILMLDLLTLAIDSTLHPLLNPGDAVILDAAPKADAKTYEAFSKIVDRLEDGNREKMLVHLYLRKGGKIAGESYKQVATVTFPFYESLQEGVTEYAGVKLRKVDVASFIGLLEHIFPHICSITDASFGVNSFGSNSKVAPKLHSLLLAFSDLTDCINDEIKILAKLEKKNKKKDPFFLNTTLIEDDWVPTLEHFGELWKEARDIPMQKGNIGEISLHDKEYHDLEEVKPLAPKAGSVKQINQPISYVSSQPVPQAPSPVQMPQQMPLQAPVAPRPQARSASIKDVFNQPQMPQMPQMQPQMGQMPMYGYPQQSMPVQMPVMQPQMGFVNQQVPYGYVPVQTGFGSQVPFGFYGNA